MHEDLYAKYKGLLFKLAYQLTGSVSDAEDAVQDVFVKIYDVPPEKLGEPKAYLCKMVANRCRDLLKSARKKREQYYGEWLPEPFVDAMDDSMESVHRNDLLSYGMLVLLERLSATERIVFVLREALGFEYAEIAKLTEKSEVNCRKLYSRAKTKMELDSEEVVHTEPANEDWVQGFLEALKQGNMNRILSMLDQDVVAVADGGGKVLAVLKPMKKRAGVAKFLSGAMRKAAMFNGEPSFELRTINGQPGVVLRSEEGVHTAMLWHVEDNLVRRLYIVRNPDKLTHIGS